MKPLWTSEVQNTTKYWIENCIFAKDNISSEKVLTLFNDTWLSRHSYPIQITCDNSIESSQYLHKEYGLKRRLTMVKNLQANRIVVRAQSH